MKNALRLASFFILLASLSSTAMATRSGDQEWHVVREGEKLLFSSRDCGVVAKALESFAQWKAAAGEHPSQSEEPHHKDGYCVAEISDALPKRISPLLHRHSFFDGPNCWNTALYAAEVVDTLRYTDDMWELDFYLKSPLCRIVGAGEKIQLGDIGLIRASIPTGGWAEVHAFYYLNPNLTFTKDDPNYASPYSLQTLEENFAKYMDAKAPARCRDTDPDNNSGCDRFLVYARCQPQEKFLRGNSWSPTQRLTPLHAKVKDLERRAHLITFGRIRLADSDSLSLIEEVSHLLDEVAASESDQLLSQAETYFLSRDRGTLSSLAYQITGFLYEQRPSEKEVVWYRHEPWQGALLLPTDWGHAALIQRNLVRDTELGHHKH